MEELGPGVVVHKYRLEQVIGRGGMGSVYRAAHVDTGEIFAVKAMHAEVAQRPVFRKRFLREARAAMAVGHPSIVRIVEVFEHDGAPMLSMELLEGESLEQTLEREHKLPLADVARILVHVTSAVGTAHALGIIHRDLKPDNIFLSKDENAPVKVLDFGIAKFTATEGDNAQTAALTRTGALMGTPFYMSPEQAFGEKDIDHRSDVWALGIILYRCLSGVLPTSGQTFGDVLRKVIATDFTPLRELAPELPEDVCVLVGRMLQRQLADRAWDLREVHNVLERYASYTTPSFGEAVPPIFDPSTVDAKGSIPPAPMSGSPVPLALTPKAIRLGGVTPKGTITMDPPAASAARASVPSAPALQTTPVDAPLAPPAKSRTWIFVALAIAALALLGLAVAIRAKGG